MIAKHVPMNSAAKSSASGLISYLTDTQAKAERVGEVVVTNCHQADPAGAALEILATQGQNRRAVSDKTYHLILSFPEGEQPASDVLRDIEDSVVDSLGFSEHQRVSVLHTDTDNLHLHLAINKIHPEKLTLIEPYRDYKTLAEVCEKLEIKHELQRDNHTPERTVSENKAKDMESHSGEVSLMSWMRAECLPALKACETWDSFNAVLQEHGLAIQPKGNGLVFVASSGATVKASTVDRSFSMAKLTAALGPLEIAPSPELKAPPAKEYHQQPIEPDLAASALFAQFQSERDSMADIAGREMAALDKSYTDALSGLQRTHALKFKAMRLLKIDPIMRRLLVAQAKAALKANTRKLKSQHLKACKQVKEKTIAQRINWADWLHKKAIAGDKDALQALQARKSPDKEKTSNVIAGKGQKQGSSSAVRDSITKTGTILYRTEGEAFREKGGKVFVSELPTHKALAAAIDHVRSTQGDTIQLKGSPAFKQSVTEFAAFTGLPITFSDKRLERDRKSITAMRAEIPAATKYIEEREEKRQNGIEVIPHKLHMPSDAGKATFKGMRTVDGVKLVLLERDNTILVAPVDESTAKRLKKHSIGDAVTLTANRKVQYSKQQAKER